MRGAHRHALTTLPVTAGQTGPRRRATPGELAAYFKAEGLDEPER